jgi:hypothetical protein
MKGIRFLKFIFLRELKEVNYMARIKPSWGITSLDFWAELNP